MFLMRTAAAFFAFLASIISICAVDKSAAVKASESCTDIFNVARKSFAPFRTVSPSAAPLSVKAPAVISHAADASLPAIYGSVIFADNWTVDDAPLGLYALPSSPEGSFEELIPDLDAQYGGVIKDGIYYSCHVATYGMSVIKYIVGHELDTHEMVYSQSLGDFYTFSMTADPTQNDKIYAIVGDINLNQYTLGTLDFGAEGVTYQLIAPLNAAYNSIACAPDGTLYGIRCVGDADNRVVANQLVKFNKVSGAVTVVGTLGATSVYPSDSSFDIRTGRFYWTCCPADETGWLYEINPTDASVTALIHFAQNEQVTGLVVPQPAAEDDAPAAVENLQAVFEGGSLSGHISFTAPALTFAGSPVQGTLSYTVFANDAVIATGTAAPGSQVSAPVTMTAPGLYTFTAYVSNSAGNGPKTKLKNVFVGKDTPVATAATLAYSDGRMNLSWLPVTAAVNGGYLNADAVTYTVTRYPDAVRVAGGISETSFSEPVAEPDGLMTYYYTVVAVCDGLVSEAAVSNSVTLGKVTPPYSADFADHGLEGFTVIDANGDGQSWIAISYFGETGARITYNPSVDMDDWLISPPIKLEAGKMYDVHASFYAQNALYPERLEIMAGNAPAVEAMTTTLMPPTTLNIKEESEPWTGHLFPEEDGTYYIGFHGISDMNRLYIWITEFSVSAPLSASAPAAPSGLRIIPGAYGDLSATLEFTAPSAALDGTPLSSLSKATVSRDGQVVSVMENPAPGALLSFSEAIPATGEVTYTVVCENAAGPGPEASVSEFIGINRPAAPASASVVETAIDGEVTVSWDAVTTDIRGFELLPEQVTYVVCRFDGSAWTPFTDDLSATSYTFQAVEGDGQEFVQYAVYARTAFGYGAGAGTDMIPVGKPYSGFELTKAADVTSYILGTDPRGGGEWGPYTDSSFSDIASVDADDFYFGMKGPYYYQWASLFTGSISLHDITDPALTFYTYNFVADAGLDINTLETQLRVKGTSDWVTVSSVTMSDAGTEGWFKVTVDLSAYAGQTVQLKWTALTRRYIYTFLDAVKVAPSSSSLPRTAIDPDSDTAPEEYYNLQGIRVESPARGIYIRRQGSSATKLIR